MRLRRLAVLSIAATAALLLAGCSASGTPAPSSPSASAAADLCSATAPSGAASDAVTVDGTVGTAPTATFTTPLDITEVERTVVTEGAGATLAEGDYVTLGMTAYDPQTGSSIGSFGYDGTANAPQQLTAGSLLGEVLGCSTEGSRIVAALPASSQGASQVFVIDVLSVTPAAQWCAAEPFEGAAPTVDFAADPPTITLPGGEAPTGVRLEVLEKGDGATVEPGDTVKVDYLGVKWSDGSTFDSSYARGEAAEFPTTGVVVGFKRALEGQTVGSRILVSMSPACAYGEAGTSSSELAGETLVFAIEIVDTRAS